MALLLNNLCLLLTPLITNVLYINRLHGMESMAICEKRSDFMNMSRIIMNDGH